MPIESNNPRIIDVFTRHQEEHPLLTKRGAEWTLEL
jgi:hypothetical protein